MERSEYANQLPTHTDKNTINPNMRSLENPHATTPPIADGRM